MICGTIKQTIRENPYLKGRIAYYEIKPFITLRYVIARCPAPGPGTGMWPSHLPMGI